MVVSMVAVVVARSIGRNPDESALESVESVAALTGAR